MLIKLVFSLLFLSPVLYAQLPAGFLNAQDLSLSVTRPLSDKLQEISRSYIRDVGKYRIYYSSDKKYSCAGKNVYPGHPIFEVSTKRSIKAQSYTIENIYYDCNSQEILKEVISRKGKDLVVPNMTDNLNGVRDFSLGKNQSFFSYEIIVGQKESLYKHEIYQTNDGPKDLLYSNKKLLVKFERKVKGSEILYTLWQDNINIKFIHSNSNFNYGSGGPYLYHIYQEKKHPERYRILSNQGDRISLAMLTSYLSMIGTGSFFTSLSKYMLSEGYLNHFPRSTAEGASGQNAQFENELKKLRVQVQNLNGVGKQAVLQYVDQLLQGAKNGSIKDFR